MELTLLLLPPVLLVGILVLVFGLTVRGDRSRKVPSDELEPIHSAGHYKRIQREKDFKEWNNEYISILQGAFLEKYKIPYNEAQLTYVAYNNYVSSKKEIDAIGDRAYWFDDCPKTNTVKSVSSGMMRTTKLDNSGTKFIPTKSYDTSFLSARTITASMITTGNIYDREPRCSCESCDFNAKMGTYNQRKRIWDHTKEQISVKYPDFVFENLPEELPELSA